MNTNLKIFYTTVEAPNNKQYFMYSFIINKEKFNNIVYSILNHLNIDQIFCISHNIASNIESAKKFVLGNPDPSFHIPKDAIKVKK